VFIIKTTNDFSSVKSKIKYNNLKVNCHEQSASYRINCFIKYLLPDFNDIDNSHLMVVCIGSDRSTGDSLGPLVGERLNTLIPSLGSEGADILWGTLKDPVHAVNLYDKINRIKNFTQKPLIIAVDASLGKLKDVGNIEVGIGPIKPGKAVNKDLPSIGDIYIRGVVNVGGFMEQAVLQSTRLYLVMSMAHVIGRGLLYILKDYYSSFNHSSSYVKTTIY